MLGGVASCSAAASDSWIALSSELVASSLLEYLSTLQLSCVKRYLRFC